MQVTSVMMLAMVASAVVSTVSMSAVMVQRAQQAATPSPAAALSALINTPNPPPRCAPRLIAVCHHSVHKPNTARERCLWGGETDH